MIIEVVRTKTMSDMSNLYRAYSAVHSSEVSDQLSESRDLISDMQFNQMNSSDLQEVAEEILEEMFELSLDIEQSSDIIVDILSEALKTSQSDLKSQKIDYIGEAFDAALENGHTVERFLGYRRSKKVQENFHNTSNEDRSSKRLHEALIAQERKNIKEGILSLIEKKTKDSSYLETNMKKRLKNNEKARKDMEKMGSMKNPQLEEFSQIRKDWSSAYYSIYEKMDPVGQEDGDIDNDGDKDKSDKYLANRRKAIGKSMGKKGKCEMVDESSIGDRTRRVVGDQRQGVHGDADAIRRDTDAIKNNLLKMRPYGAKGFPSVNSSKDKKTTQVAHFEPEGEMVEGFPNVKPANRAGDAGTSGLMKIDTGSGSGYVNKHSGGRVLPAGSVNKIMSGQLMVKGGKPKNKTQLAHFELEGDLVEDGAYIPSRIDDFNSDADRLRRMGKPSGSKIPSPGGGGQYDKTPRYRTGAMRLAKGKKTTQVAHFEPEGKLLEGIGDIESIYEELIGEGYSEDDVEKAIVMHFSEGPELRRVLSAIGNKLGFGKKKETKKVDPKVSAQIAKNDAARRKGGDYFGTQNPPAKTDPVKKDPVKKDPVKSDPVKSDPVKPAPKPAAQTALQKKTTSTNAEYDRLRKSDPAAAKKFGMAASKAKFGNQLKPKTSNPLMSTPTTSPKRTVSPIKSGSLRDALNSVKKEEVTFSEAELKAIQAKVDAWDVENEITEFVAAPAGSPIDRHSRGISKYDTRTERQIRRDNFAAKRTKMLNQPKTP